MVALALIVALGQFGEPGDLELPRYKLVRVPEPERFVRRANVRDFWSEGAAKRFVGALAGGVVGAAVPLAIGLAIPPLCPVGCGSSPVVAALGMVAALTAVAGATTAWALLGGALSPGAAVAGAVGGLTLGTLFLIATLLISPATPGSKAPAWPAAVAASGLATSLVALSLEARHEALEEAPFVAVPVWRFVATALSTVLTAGLGALLSIGLGAITFSAAPAISLGSLALALAPLVPYAVHRGLGGRATVGWSYVGWLASLGVAGVAALGVSASILLGGFTTLRDARADTALVFSGAAGVLAIALGTPLFLEYAHGQELLDRSEVAGQPRLSLAPVRGGAVGTLALTF